jgi:RNA polymerase sigma-70 factor (ECF subfamily)
MVAVASVGTVFDIDGESEDLALPVARARDGDRDALEKVVRSSYDLVFPVCRRLIGNDADAADATQEALISIVRGLPRFDGRSRYSTWVYRIAVNAAIDELRRRSRRPAPRTSELTLIASGDDMDSMVESIDVDFALLEVPLDFRAAVVLRDLCGLDYEEISTVLAIPPGTVRSRIARGRALLVDLLGPDRSGPSEAQMRQTDD